MILRFTMIPHGKRCFPNKVTHRVGYMIIHNPDIISEKFFDVTKKLNGKGNREKEEKKEE